jgi:sugar phosphate isomerase/epimerase
MGHPERETAMIRAGVASITFRKFVPREVICWAAHAKLDGIEWGGDVHVPHGKVEPARQVAAMTRDAGLVVSSYGSYYRVGQEEPDLFPRVLETATALGAPIVRVWPGRLASRKADKAFRNRVAEDGRRIAEMADPAKVRIACEWHGDTLTDTAESARRLFEAVGHPAFRTYWQPHRRMAPEDCRRDLEAALERLIGLHVFQWDLETGARLALADGETAWKAYLARAKEAADMFAMLEFVKGDDPEQMVRDAATLRGWLREVNDFTLER